MLRRVLFVLLVSSLVLVLAGAMGSVAPLFDLANLVMLPVASITALCGLAMAWIARRWWKKAGFALAGLAGVAMAWPPAAAPSICDSDAARLRVAWLNAQGSSDPAPVTAWLDSERPDVVAMGELHPGSEAVREAVRARFPFTQTCMRREACSTVLFSRVPPLAQAGLARGDAANRRALSAARMTLPLAGESGFNVMAVHLSRPLPLGRQGRELAELETHIERPADTIIMGDFNSTARMHVLRAFARRNQFGIGMADAPTWPLRWQGSDTPPIIQIDQVLAGRNWAIERVRTTPGLGSDHAGIVADLCRRV